jgi:GGDEF domain-containing protein
MHRMERHFDAKPLAVGDARTHVRFSFGVAQSDDPGADAPAALLKLADLALYENKRARKARNPALAEAGSPGAGVSHGGQKR